MNTHKGSSGSPSGVPAAGKKRRVLIVDDHPIVQHGLTQLINQEPDLIVCSTASSSPEALTAVSEDCPDLVLADISIEGSNGIELAKTIHRMKPKLPILMLSMHDEAIYAERALRAGAKGYLMKQEAADTVVKALRTVLSGECYLSERMKSQMLAGMTASPHAKAERIGVERLSDREIEVFGLIGQGMSTRQIAQKLHLSVKTVETHCQRIKTKLNLEGATQLMHYAVHWTHGLADKEARKP
jgi:DNA-binding NarL/FixJ family response regulator